MAVTFAGFRTINTSIGNLKCILLEADFAYSEINSSAFSCLVTYFDHSVLYNSRSNISYCAGPFTVTNEIGELEFRVLSNAYYMLYRNNTLLGNAGGGVSGACTIYALVHCTDDYYTLAYLTVFPDWLDQVSMIDPEPGVFGYLVATTIISSPMGFYLIIFGNGENNIAARDIITEAVRTGPQPPEPDTDPYAPGGVSGPGGGTGTFSDTSTPIDFPPLPNISVEDTGFINLWNPSASQLRLLADYMWDTSLFDLNTWHKLFANPMDAILGLSIVPVTIPNGATQFVVVGNIATTIPMTRAGAQFIEVDCGSLLIEEKWGAYLDYSPYTKAELYLPYCGTHSIDVDNIMGKSVHIKYHVDILSGSCCAYVKCGDSILYSFIGQCSSSIPVNGADFTTMINGVIQAATAVGSMVPSGGMAAPMAAPNLAQMVPNVLKPEIEKSGSMSGTGGMLALQTPYLILTRPNQALPAHQNHYTGYPSFITQTLGNLSGYTEVELIHLEGIPATGDELDELENLLKSGVIF